MNTKKIVLTALFTALTAVATMFIRIPLFIGYVNLGDVFVLLAVFVLGPILGTMAGAIGACVADLVGYITYAPGTLIIKALMALVAWLVCKVLTKITHKALIGEIIGGVFGAIVMAFGYFVYEILFFVSAGVAIINLPWNLLQGAVGVVLSVAILRILKVTKVIDKINE